MLNITPTNTSLDVKETGSPSICAYQLAANNTDYPLVIDYTSIE